MTDKFDYKEYARQMRENSVVEKDIVRVSKELWFQVADKIDDASDVINRQKAEIERLKEENNHFANIGKMVSEIKAEAIKDFSELLKNDWIGNLYYCEDLDITDWIDNLVKEMVGE